MYQVKVKYNKTHENGLIKPATDVYLVDALSFTEAEARVIEYVQPYISGEFSVTDIKRSTIAEIWHGDGDYWWEAQLEFITIDERTACEKRKKVRMLVQADTLPAAMEAVRENMKSSMADYEAVNIKKTAVMDVILP